MQRGDSFEKTLMLGKIEGRRRRRWQRMVGWYHWLNGDEFKWTLGVGNGHRGLACCSPGGLDWMTELNWTEDLILNIYTPLSPVFFHTIDLLKTLNQLSFRFLPCSFLIEQSFAKWDLVVLQGCMKLLKLNYYVQDIPPPPWNGRILPNLFFSRYSFSVLGYPTDCSYIL